MPGLREYVKAFYPMGPVWGPAGSPMISASTSASAKGKSVVHGPSAPPPPSTCLFTSDGAPQQPRASMSAVFQEIGSGKSVTAGIYSNIPS